MAGRKSDVAPVARRYFVRGRVQGVGYRYFAQRAAVELGVRGYARNLDDGRVEVYALAPQSTLDEYSGRLWKGPLMSDVRGVEEQEASVMDRAGFRIE